MMLQQNYYRHTVVENTMLSDNAVIKQLAINAYFSNSPMGLNRKYLNMYKKPTINEEEKSLEWLSLSLLDVRQHQWYIPNYDTAEINEMIVHVCTS